MRQETAFQQCNCARQMVASSFTSRRYALWSLTRVTGRFQGRGKQVEDSEGKRTRIVTSPLRTVPAGSPSPLTLVMQLERLSSQQRDGY